MKKLFVCLMLLSVMLVPTALGESAEVVEPAPLEEYAQPVPHRGRSLCGPA